MARSRNIKPGFFKNEYLADMPPLTRLLFIALWCEADREGRLEERPRKFAAEYFAYDALGEHGISTMLEQLEHSPGKFIIRYKVNGVAYIQINNFNKHQNPHIKEPVSIIPKPQVSENAGENTGMIPASCKHHTCMVLAGLIPDSPFLIPDSLIPDSDKQPLSGKPDEAPKDSIPYAAIIEHFNNTCGTHYRDIETNRTLIRPLWKLGFREEDFEKVISTMYAKWGNDSDMRQYIRPATLFQPKKFESYLNAIVSAPRKRDVVL